MQITWFVGLPCSDTKSVYGWLQPLYRLPKGQHALICLEEAVKMGSLQGLSFIETVPRKLADYAILFLQKESLSLSIYHHNMSLHSVLTFHIVTKFTWPLPESRRSAEFWPLWRAMTHLPGEGSPKHTLQRETKMDSRRKAKNSCLKLFWVCFIFYLYIYYI